MKDSLKRFRLISLVEGLSYLILVFFAMPVKYLGDNPFFVKVFGMTHGVLFILFVLFLFDVMRKLKWDLKFSTILFIYSLIPFGFLSIEKKVKTQDEII